MEKNLETLQRRGKINVKTRRQILRIWKDRDSYHHLNPTIERDHSKLEAMAEQKAKLLSEVEATVFGFRINNGVLIPDQPKYWDTDSDTAQVYLRLDP